MDSLTQIVLGAAVGEAVAGKKLGNKAMLWGAVAGTIPDLDVLLNPWLDVVEELSWHRSLTHSLLFALLMAPLLALLLRRIYPNSPARFKDWLWLFLLGFITHTVLDSFTTWGTQLFWPFSDYGVAFYNIFVIDPFYTLPFLLFLIWAATKDREDPARHRLNTIGLLVSSSYLLFTFIAQSAVEEVVEESLEQQGIAYEEYITKATPFNAILWAIVVKTEEGYYNGFYSLLDDETEIEFQYFPKNAELLEPYIPHPKLEKLLHITKGYYSVKAGEEGLLIRDLRFGQFNGWQDEGGEFVFTYTLEEEEGELQVGQKEFSFRPDDGYLKAFLDRIAGK